MTDAPTPEIRKLADTVNLYCTRSAAHGYENCQLCAMIREEIAKVIAQALQDERAKRGAVIEQAGKAACHWCREGAMFETKYETHRVASAEVSDPKVFTVEWCDAKDIYALDPEATQAWDALRERIENELLIEICKVTNAGLRDSEGNPYSNEELKSKAISTSRAGWRESQRVRERERKLYEALNKLIQDIDIQLDWSRMPGNNLPISVAKSWREKLAVLAETEGL